MTRFYVAARFGRQAEAREVADQVTALTRWESTAEWLTATTADDMRAHQEHKYGCATAAYDINDVRRADIVFALTEANPDGHMVPAGWARGGRHVEVGAALALGKPVVLLGPRENVFHALCPVAESVEHAVDMMRIHAKDAS